MTNQSLIPTIQGQLNGESQSLVNARELHQFLEVGRDFSNWIKSRINDYGFDENSDYTCSPNLASSEKQGLSKLWAGKNRIDYHLSLDMAKELCMVERSEKGRQARRYFIAIESHAKQAINALDWVIDDLQDEYLKAHPSMLKLIKYSNMDLTQAEISKLMDLSKDAVRRKLKRLAELQLVDYTPNPHFVMMGKKGMAALQQKRLFEAKQSSLELELCDENP